MKRIMSIIGVFKRVPMAKYLLIGEIIYLLIGEIIVIALGIYQSETDVWMWALGFFEGVMLAVYIMMHMALSLEDTVTMYEDEALKHTRKTYVFRMLILVAVFFVIIFFRLGNIVAALFGLMALKVSAYVQPVMHKFTQKLNEGR